MLVFEEKRKKWKETKNMSNQIEKRDKKLIILSKILFDDK